MRYLSRNARVSLLAASILHCGCSMLGTLTGGYALPTSKRHGEGGEAIHAAVGVGSGTRGDGAGFGGHVRWKNPEGRSEFALGGHIYMLSMEVNRGRVFSRTGDWGTYGRLGVNFFEVGEYDGDEFASSLGRPSTSDCFCLSVLRSAHPSSVTYAFAHTPTRRSCCSWWALERGAWVRFDEAVGPTAWGGRAGSPRPPRSLLASGR